VSGSQGGFQTQVNVRSKETRGTKKGEPKREEKVGQGTLSNHEIINIW